MKYDRYKYLEYINKSEEWRNKKKEIFSLRGRKCERCLSKKKIHVHHGTYERLFNELLSDLFVLCEPCHNEYHKTYEKITVKTTRDFIKGTFIVKDVKLMIRKGHPKNKKQKKYKRQKMPKSDYYKATKLQRVERAMGLRRLYSRGEMTKEEYMSKLYAC